MDHADRSYEPTDNVLTGTVQFRNSSGAPAAVRANNQTASSFAYSVPPRGAQTLQTGGTVISTAAGGRARCARGHSAAPFGLAIFSFRNVNDGIRGWSSVCARGDCVSSLRRGFGRFQGERDRIDPNGIAVTIPQRLGTAVTLELFKLDGSPTGMRGTLSFPRMAGRHLPKPDSRVRFNAAPFQGTLRVSSPVPVSMIGLRGITTNARIF